MLQCIRKLLTIKKETQRMISVFDVADWFLSKETMTHKKVQKLCYYYKAWGYALYDNDMIPGYDFQAWVHGPVSPELYQKYRGKFWQDLEMMPDNSSMFSDKELYLLKSVWETYGDMSANALEAQTHTEWPWREARGNLSEFDPCENVIRRDVMRDYYRSVYTGGQGE